MEYADANTIHSVFHEQCLQNMSVDSQVKETDLLVIAAKAEEEAASLEIWLFEDADAEGERNAYVHHDIPLPAFPLAVSWMRFNPTSTSCLFCTI